MKSVNTVIDRVNGTMSMEGMPLTEENKARIRKCYRNKQALNYEIAHLIKKHSKK